VGRAEASGKGWLAAAAGRSGAERRRSCAGAAEASFVRAEAPRRPSPAAARVGGRRGRRRTAGRGASAAPGARPPAPHASTATSRPSEEARGEAWAPTGPEDCALRASAFARDSARLRAASGRLTRCTPLSDPDDWRSGSDRRSGSEGKGGGGGACASAKTRSARPRRDDVAGRGPAPDLQALAGGGAALGGGASPEAAVTVAQSPSGPRGPGWSCCGGSTEAALLFLTLLSALSHPHQPSFSRFVPSSAGVPSPRDGKARPGGGWQGSGCRRSSACHRPRSRCAASSELGPPTSPSPAPPFWTVKPAYRNPWKFTIPVKHGEPWQAWWDGARGTNKPDPRQGQGAGYLPRARTEEAFCWSLRGFWSQNVSAEIHKGYYLSYKYALRVLHFGYLRTVGLEGLP
jgi:hypothetical protein